MSAIKVFPFCLGLIHSGKTAQHLSVMIFRGISGFLLMRAGFVPGKTKKGEKHRKGTLTDDRGSAHANLTFELEETAMSKKNKQKQQGGQTQPTDTAEK